MFTTVNLIIIGVILLVVVIGGWLIYSWVQKQDTIKGEKVLTDAAIDSGHLPSKAPKNNKFITSTLKDGKSITVAEKIKSYINTFSRNDFVGILSTLKDNVKTKTDMSKVVGQLQLFDIQFYKEMQGLTVDQQKTFAAWLKALPDYIYV